MLLVFLVSENDCIINIVIQIIQDFIIEKTIEPHVSMSIESKNKKMSCFDCSSYLHGFTVWLLCF